MVSGEHDSAAIARVVSDHVEDAGLAREVEPGDRLIEEENIGARGDRLGDQHPLALTSRERAIGAASKM